jgi:hypothetical protein
MDPGDKVKHKKIGIVARVESTRFGLREPGDTGGDPSEPVEYVTVRLPWFRWEEWPASEVELIEPAPFGGLFDDDEA